MKYLVTWYDGNNERVTIVDDTTDRHFPFAVEPSLIADDCEHINVIVALPQDFGETLCVMDDAEQPIESLTL